MVVVQAHTWKELQEQDEIIENQFQDFQWKIKANTKFKWKNVLVVDTPTKHETNPPFYQNASLSQRTQKKCSFKDDQILRIFNMLIKNKKTELPEPKRPEEVGHINDPKYFHYLRIVSHTTKYYFILKDKL